MVGFLAYSLSGHDKGSLYIIIKEDKNYVWVVDGILKTVDKPKKKNKKHIQIITQCKLEIVGESYESVANEQVKRTIKLYNKGI